MAELSVGALNLTITADGSAAISELERVKTTAEGVGGELKGMDGADLSGVAGGASEAAEGLNRLGAGAGEAAGGLDRAAQQGQKAGKTLQEVGKSLSEVGQKMTTFATLPIVGLLTASVAGASNLTETLGKTEVVFGEMTDRVMDWSRTSVQAMGLAQGSALEFASTYGDMATGMGLAQSAATDMAMNLTQLAADLASFKNISTDLAAQKLNAVFTGETEGLKSLGIVMTQTNLQAFAMSQGITQSVSSMSQAEQVMLRYRYVMEATKNAQGDFARTGESLANQTRKLGETVKQMGESFGAQLVPMVTPVVAKLQQMAQAFAELDGGAKNTIIAIAGVVAAIGPALLIGGKVIGLITGIQTALAGLAINPALLAVAGIAAAVAGVVALKNALDQANGEIDRTGESYQRLQGAVDKQVNAKLGITVDDAELSKVPEDGELDSTDTVTVVTGGAEALSDMQSAVAELASAHYGSITISESGESVDVDALISGIKDDLNSLEGTVTITADGSAILGEGSEGTIAQIQAKLNSLRAVVPFVEGPGRAALETAIDGLQTKLNVLKSGAEVSVSYKEDGEAAKNAKAFADAVAQLPQDETYSATGQFVVSGMGAEAIQEYAEALAAAATATGDYKTAVEQLDKLADAEAERQRGEVITQLTADQADLTAAYNDGILTEEQYNAAVQQGLDDAQARMKLIEEETAARKANNALFANGTASDDLGAYTQGLKELYSDRHVTQEQADNASRQLVETRNAGGDMAEKSAEGQTVLQRALANSAQQYQTLQQAVADYQGAMAQADVTEQQANDRYAAQQEVLGQAREAVEAYGMQVTDLGGEGAFANISEGMDPAAVEVFRAAITNANGSLMDYSDSMDAVKNVADLQAKAEADHAQSLQTVTDQRQAATDALQAQVDAATQAQGAFSNVDALQGQLDAVGDTGVEVTDTMQQAVIGTQRLAQDMAGALESGGDPLAAWAQSFEGVGEAVSQVSGGITDGLVQAMGDTGAASSAGQALGSAAVEGVADGAGTHSPSTYTLEAGRGIADGLAQGMGDTGTASSAGQALGQAAINGVSQGVASGSGAVGSSINAAVASAAGSAAGAARSSGSAIGSNLIAGAAAGVRSAAGQLASQAAEAVRAAIAAAKAAANIQSPSRVMRDEVGVMLMRGAGEGLVAETPRVVQQMKESTGRLISGATTVAAGSAGAMPALSGAAPINYDAMGAAMSRAMGKVQFGFSVGERELAQATRNAASREQAFRARQIQAGYGG